jgi:beta-lactamase superfamily II metal-dependent hydrolase
VRLPGNLNFQFLDVGQGDGIFITFPNGRTMLVDLGSTKNKKLTSTDVFKYFEDHVKFRDNVLDYLVLTHGDRDHYNLVKSFIERFRITVTNLLYGGRATDYGSLLPGLATTIVRGTGVCPFPLNSTEYFGGAEVVVLAMDSPTARSADAWRKNTSSVVLRLEYARQSVILSGDATIDTENHILATLTEQGHLARLKSTVLKVGHHGSARTSILPKWIEAIKPEFIFISSDRSGSLSEQAKTGHRLPQQLAIDIILKNTKLHEDRDEHSYVSSYDPKDYTDYINPEDGKEKGFKNPHEGTDWGRRRAWVQFRDKRAIFTTLAAMDMRSADASEADQGAQYELNISDEGAVIVRTTLETAVSV